MFVTAQPITVTIAPSSATTMVGSENLRVVFCPFSDATAAEKKLTVIAIINNRHLLRIFSSSKTSLEQADSFNRRTRLGRGRSTRAATPGLPRLPALHSTCLLMNRS
jgi:hypothetical protein